LNSNNLWKIYTYCNRNAIKNDKGSLRKISERGVLKVKADFCIDQFGATTSPYPAAVYQLSQKSAGVHLLARGIESQMYSRGFQDFLKALLSARDE